MEIANSWELGRYFGVSSKGAPFGPLDLWFFTEGPGHQVGHLGLDRHVLGQETPVTCMATIKQ